MTYKKSGQRDNITLKQMWAHPEQWNNVIAALKTGIESRVGVAIESRGKDNGRWNFQPPASLHKISDNEQRQVVWYEADSSGRAF